MNTRMHEFLTLTEKDLKSLIARHYELNQDFSIEIKIENYPYMNQTLSRNDLVSRLIKGKPLQEREAHFITNSISFCLALEQNKKEKAETLKKEIEYFKHCFLEDSQYWKMPIEYQTLCKFLE